MNVLVIDDLRVFDFRKLTPQFDDSWRIEYARNSEEAIEALESRSKWDMVMWDHDLGGDDTVMPVVTWLEESLFNGYKPQFDLCVIHTSNPAGRRVLDAVLSRHYRIQHIDADMYLKGSV